MAIDALNATRANNLCRGELNATAGATFNNSASRPSLQASRSCVSSAERQPAMLLDTEVIEKVSSSFRRWASNCGCLRQPLRRLREKRQLFKPCAAIEIKSGGRTRATRQLPCLLCKALSNPSLKASPNSVAHWLSSAGPAAHFALALQRATLSGPP